MVEPLPFQDSADTSDTRRVILGELLRTQEAFLAAQRPGGPDGFEWHGAAHWIDRERWLALPARDVEAFANLLTLPSNGKTEDLLDFYGGASRTLAAIDVVDVLAWLVAGTLAKHSWSPNVTQLLNLVAVQPLVNPASGPLFWVALNAALAGDDGPDDVMAIMRPLVFDMSTYPASRSAAPAVREAQARLFRTYAPDQLPAGWATLDDRAWAEACKQVVAAAQHGIETHVFDVITRRAASIRDGVRPR